MLSHALAITTTRLLTPLDAARSHLLRWTAPWARPILVDREKRVAVVFSGIVALSFALAVVSPLLLLALGPVLVGVPHLLADLRYLVFAQGFGKRPAFLVLVFVPLVALAITSDVRFGFASIVLAALGARASSLRRLGLILVGGGLSAIAWWRPYETAVVAAHVHNVFAVGLLFFTGRGTGFVWRFVPIALFVFAALLLATGVYLPWTDAVGGFDRSLGGITLDDQAYVFAPPSFGIYSLHALVLFAFAQSVHYGVWLRVMPEDARPSHTPRSFAQSARALVADVPWPIVAAAVLGTAGIAVWAVADLAAARDGYFRFAYFHGYMELAIVGVLIAEGRFGKGRTFAA